MALAAAAILPQGMLANDVDGQEAPAKKVAILIAADIEDNLANQEKEALKIFKTNYPDGTIFNLNTISDINADNYSALWYHLERNVFDNDATYFSETVKNALASFVNNGGNLLLTKNAGCMLKYLVSNDLDFEHYGFNDGKNSSAYWTMNVAAFGDQSQNPIFSNCTITTDREAKLIPLLDINDKFLIDNNIGWNLNAEKRDGMENFCVQHNAQLLGTWGNYDNGWEKESVFMVEFKPQGERKGTIIFNGIAAYQLWVSDNSEVDNAAYANLVALTTGALNYLGAPVSSENNGDDNGDDENPGNASGQNFKPLNTNAVAFIRANNPSDDELGAEATFRECYPKGHVISVDELIEYTDYNESTGKYELNVPTETGSTHFIEAVWIHINREGVTHTPKINGDAHHYTLPTEFMSDDCKDALYNYCIDGGKMFVSGMATLLINRIGRQEDFYTPNVFGNATSKEINSVGEETTSGGRNTTLTWDDSTHDMWGATGQLWDYKHENCPYNCGHAVYGITFDVIPGYYAALTSDFTHDLDGVTHYTKLMILGPKENSTISAYNNNCMWYVPDAETKFWAENNNAQLIGSFDHQSLNDLDDQETRFYGIVEFLPDDVVHHDYRNLFGEYPRKVNAPKRLPNTNQYNNDQINDTNANRPWLGHIVANGLGAFQFANKDDNAHYDNLRNMAFNSINYLTQTYHVDNKDDENIIEPDPVLPSGIEEVAVEAEDLVPVYYNLQGVRVEHPSNGIFVKVQGSKVTKVIR